MKRILIIIASVIVFVGIGVGIYFYFFANKPALTVKPGGSTLPLGGGASIQPANTTVTSQDLGVPVQGAGTVVAPRLIRITDNRVALGSVAIYMPGRPASSSTVATGTPALPAVDPEVKVEYVERESGNIYAYTAHTRTLTRLTNKTLPGAQKASWLSDGSLAFVQFLEKNGADEHIDTYALPATGSDGYFLEQDLAQASALGTTTLLTLLPGTNGSTASLSTPSGTGIRTLFTSALSSLLVTFGNSTYIATTKGSSVTDGYAFSVDPASGTFTRALGPLPGLSTLLSPSGKLLLYNYNDAGKMTLGVLDLTTHTATRLPLATLSEKCAWSNDSLSLYCGIPTGYPGTLPDDWYQGTIAFSDRLWKIDLRSRVASLVIDPKQAGGVDVDAVGLTVDRTNDILVFMNRRDGTLWAYDL